ncbi:Integrase catalytic domain-containing protein, partial [Durusdinium trenchii]
MHSGGTPSPPSRGFGNLAPPAPSNGACASAPGPCSAASWCQQLDASALPPAAAPVQSAFEMLGKPVQSVPASSADPQEVMLKALTAALSGDRKSLPSWNGDVSTLRPWLRQLTLWEMDNNLPKQKWGLKLLQAFSDQSPPRRIAETVDLPTLTSEAGYSAILTAIMTKYGPYLEAAGPAAIETFFYGTERSRSENLSSYVAAKEVALQEMEAHLGEKLPGRIAGRILLRHANLSDAQREAMAVKYNALLTFEQAAAALRPLDRPDALVQKVAKTFATSSGHHDYEEDEDDELVPDEVQAEEDDEEGPESDGQGNLTFLCFDPAEEYTEEEATYICAYNSAYKDVRRELQARRKGRQFFKKGNGPPVQKKGKTKGLQRKGHGGKGRGHSSFGRGRGHGRGTPDDLLARTKCFSCGGLGHMSKDCPQQEPPSHFFVSHGGHEQQRIYAVSVKPSVQKQLEVFAGVRTESFEGVVDTAAEEAVIGSTAMDRLRAALGQFGLRPVEASGTTATCAGIGGSATIKAVYDIPIGVAKTNGLLRVTEIEDVGAFQTPFLLPISFIELVGGVIDTGKNMFMLKGGKKTTMRRLPSGHRTISALEFNGRWKLPEGLAKELTISSDGNPFLLPRTSVGDKLQQRPGVAVWLKKDSELIFMGSMDARTTLVHPSEILPKHMLSNLDRSRVTSAYFLDDTSISIHDTWHLPSSRQLPFWSGDVFFELLDPFSPSTSPSTVSSACVVPRPQAAFAPSAAANQVKDSKGKALALKSALKPVCKQSQASCAPPTMSTEPQSSKITQWLVQADKEAPPASKKKTPTVKLLAAWRRMAQLTINMILTTIRQSATDYLLNRHRYELAEPVKESAQKAPKQIGDGRIRRGIGQPLRRSTACKTWHCEPSDCAHPEDQLRQRGSKNFYWWTCLDCGSRWARVEWAADAAVNSGAQSSTDPPTAVELVTKSLMSYPAKLPPPKHRSDLPTLTITELSPSTEPMAIQDVSNRTSAPVTPSWLASPSEMPETPPAAPLKTSGRMSSRSQSADRRRGMASGVRPAQHRVKPRAHFRNSTEQFEIHSSASEWRSEHHDHHEHYERWQVLARIAHVMPYSILFTENLLQERYDYLLKEPYGNDRIPDGLNPLHGDPFANSSSSLPSSKMASFPLNASLTELGRTDFDIVGAKILGRQERSQVIFHATKFLDHVGEIYSPPRVTPEARRQGLRARLALDLTTGWNFSLPEHRKKAKELIKKWRPAVLILSPPCTTYSPLRRLSNFKRDYQTVMAEEKEGDVHMDFSVELAEDQIAEGRGFVMEQPLPATSWSRPSVKRLMEHPDVHRLELDQCRFGLRASKGPFKDMPVRKPTALATNLEGLAEFVEKKCLKQHQHGMLLGGSAKEAAVYTPSFVKALVAGIKAALGIAPTKKTTAETLQWFQWGQAMGHLVYDYARETAALDDEVSELYGTIDYVHDVETEETYGKFIGSPGQPPRGDQFPEGCPGKKVTAWALQNAQEANRLGSTLPEEEDNFDAVQELRQNMRQLDDQPRIAEALKKVETFQSMDDGNFSLPPHLRREVHKIHRNLGHPALEIFVRALRNSGAKQEVLSWTKHHFRCPTCDARPRVSPQRPGHLHRAMEFNSVIGLDLVFLEAFGQLHVILNMICWGTNYQQAALCRDKSADEVLNVFMNEWIKHYGVPSLIIVDRGKEFENHQFQETIGGLGAAIHYTDVESPWQNTRTEKAGGVLKEKIMATIHQTTATIDELPLVLAEVVSSRNRYMDRFGFSPMQRVFGRSLRLPASIMATDALDRELVEAAAPEPVRRSWEIREAASREWLRRQDQAAIRRASRAQSRTADRKPLPPGTWVYVFRDSPSYHGWVGPGVLIAPDLNDRAAWVSMRGRLWKTSREQLRPATPEEELGAELVVELTKDMLDKLHRKPGHTQIAYQDITHETFPEDADLEDVHRVLRVEEERREVEDTPMERETTDSTHQPMAEEEEFDLLSNDTTMTPDASQTQSRRASIQTDTAEEKEALPPIEEENAMQTEDLGLSSNLPERRQIQVDEGSHGSMHVGPPAPVPDRSRSPPLTRPRPNSIAEVPETPPLGYVPPSRAASSTAPAMPYPFQQQVPPLPIPPGNSFYLEVIDFDGDDMLRQMGSKSPFIGATWRRERGQPEPVLQARAPRQSKSFAAWEAEASYCDQDRCMYVVKKAKSSFGQVEFSKLAEGEKKKFRQSRLKEVNSLIQNKAVKVLSLEESLAFEEQFPEQVINSRFVDRYKPKDVGPDKIELYKKKAIDEGMLEAIALEEDQTNPKSRLCVIGWEDPQIHEVERSSPTPLSTSLHCCLQLAASRKWQTRVRDVKTAFLQALPTTRKRKLAIRQPRDESLEGYDPRQLLLLCTEVYGLVSGPSWWRRSLLKLATEDLGFEVNPYDKCVLTLPSADPSKKLTEGFLVIEVDDIAEAGSARHQELMTKMESMLTFGKVDNLQSSTGSNYAGRRLRQRPDFSFEADMDEFIYTRLQPIALARRVLKKDSAKVKLSENEKTQLRGLIASLNWLAREGRPDVAAAASILASAFPEPAVSHILAANAMVRHVKTSPIKMVIHSIEEKDLRNILVADSSFDTSGRERSQHGWLLGFTNPWLNQGREAPVSLMQWRSKRLRRKAASSLLCEAISLSAATAALERQDVFMESIRMSHFKPRVRQKSEDEKLAAMGKSTVIASESASFCDPNSIVVVDAKSLYDALCSDQCSGDDERSALEIAIIKESLSIV